MTFYAVNDRVLACIDNQWTAGKLVNIRIALRAGEKTRVMVETEHGSFWVDHDQIKKLD